MPRISKTGAGALLGVFVIFAACATPDNSAAELASTDTIKASMEGQVAPDGSVIRCRSIQVTGSRFPAKECKSEKTWEEFDKAMAENAKSATDGFQRLNTGCAVSGTC